MNPVAPSAWRRVRRQAGWLLATLGLWSCQGAWEPTSSSSRAPLVGGSATPVLAVLSPTQLSAVGVLRFEGSQVCTGVWVGTSHFLTAAHCLNGDRPVTHFDVASVDARGEPVLVPVVAASRHPGVDVVMLQLGVEAEVTRIEPLAWPRPSAAATVGEALEVAGSGFGTPTTGRGLAFGVFDVLAVEGTRLTLAPAPPVGICHGDSGGPAFRSDGQVVGLVSEGDPSCQGRTHLVGLAALHGWYASLDRQPVQRPKPCSTQGATACAGPTLTTCQSGWLRETRCDLANQVCVSSAFGAACRPRPCEGEADARGRCDGDVARWCHQNVLRVERCGDDGRRCGETVEGSRCVVSPRAVRPPAVTPELGDAPAAGCQHVFGSLPLAVLAVSLARRRRTSVSAASSSPLLGNRSS